ncbi:hypothetical protein BC939DRAFT_470773 [Gamsiella multidivaricata]|uniref:uncharacterized protein n=1 Tax=Gamsiella multidivaricata TaxID=101098 RepID=UPI0022208DD9|nr:uncharacterized protein BC939DRAFT_470773 [Gamsiella multidivaricata]KAI7815997.1 hypothetical protein BC939DRAFT_470773 [Gamsiella multidivaricata]
MTSTMAHDIRILHFRIPYQATLELQTQDQTGTIAKTGIHDWMCQLSILEDKSTIRGALGPLPSTVANRVDFLLCCSFQIIPSLDQDPEGTEVLLSKKIKSDDLFKRGIEFYLDREDIWIDGHYEFRIILSSYPLKLLGPPDGSHWTHTLTLSECDPVARNIDPLVEMMTQFEHHIPTSDVEFRFLSKAGMVLDRLRAHHAVLSIFPVFSQMMAQAQSNPYQRALTTVLRATIDLRPAFERMLGFIYSGRLPQEGFVPRSEQWRASFLLSREYGLDKCASSIVWMEWHLCELEQVVTDENVLEIYFGWGREFASVAQMCVRHVAERSQVPFRGVDLGSYVMEVLKGRFQGQRGCFEFQEALVAMLMKMYADQQHQQRTKTQGRH